MNRTYNKLRSLLLLSLLAFFAAGCASGTYSYREPLYDLPVGPSTVLSGIEISPELEDKILALDPDSISENEIQSILSFVPAPRIVNIHGGIYPVHVVMKSFSRFLVSMGYPSGRIRNPGDGSYSYSCYESSGKLAGIIAWYYEKEGMRPMIIGHSQGGIQAVKVLHQLAGNLDRDIPVWNPLTDTPEERYAIVDPITGTEQPVVGMKIPYATAVGAGGFTRFLPNQWNMAGKLRSIPDSVEHFTGFYMGMDLIGGDLLGFGSSNKYHPNGTANVRNVKLPATYSHVTVPRTSHLAKSREIRDWINSFKPSEEPEVNAQFESSADNILWAADVWHSIKKHWALELKRIIQARRKQVTWQSVSYP